jgi:hypothetical protein
MGRLMCVFPMNLQEDTSHQCFHIHQELTALA